MYRNRKLLNLARNSPCMLRIEGTCNSDPATTVAAHSNDMGHGKATSCKAHDCYMAFACSSCHMALDQGMGSREEKDFWFQRGMERTWLYLWDKGLIEVKS